MKTLDFSRTPVRALLCPAIGVLLPLLNLHPAQAADLRVPAQYPTIQEAINAAAEGDRIILTTGTYRGPGNRGLSLGVKNLTITSDSLECIIDCEGQATFLDISGGQTSATTISRIVVQNAFGGASLGGALSINFDSNPTIDTCIFRNCNAAAGGAVYISIGSHPTFQGCTFTANTANIGGAIFLQRASVTLTNTDFISNTGPGSGGAIYSQNDTQPTDVSLTAINCHFNGNSANNGAGGGIVATLGTVTLTGCRLTDNTADQTGGGAELLDTIARISQCTFSQNQAGFTGGGLSCSGDIRIANSILSGNVPNELAPLSGTITSQITVSHSTVTGGLPAGTIDGGGNNYGDPLFVDVAGRDFRLRPESPCVDAGDNSLLPPDTYDLDGDGDTQEPHSRDAAGNPRLIGGTVDMGAYELPATPGVDLRMGFTLTRDANTGEIIATVTLRNRGTTTANAVQLTEIRLGGVAPSEALPSPPVSLDTTTVSTRTFRFPSVPAGQRTTLKVTGRYRGGTFGGTYRVSVP